MDAQVTRFIPPHPPRGAGPVPVWRGFFGERARTAVYGWSERAFEEPRLLRHVLGYRVHIPLEPDCVQRVLLDNAAKYAPTGTTISIESQLVGTSVRLQIGDEGPGIPRLEQERVFDKFYRARDAKLVNGSGLGLYISKLIVESHGGRIWADSTLGQGSTFHVALPLAL